MRVCLVPLKIEIRNPLANVRRFQRLAERIAERKPDLVCLEERMRQVGFWLSRL